MMSRIDISWHSNVGLSDAQAEHFCYPFIHSIPDAMSECLRMQTIHISVYLNWYPVFSGCWCSWWWGCWWRVHVVRDLFLHFALLWFIYELVCTPLVRQPTWSKETLKCVISIWIIRLSINFYNFCFYCIHNPHPSCHRRLVSSDNCLDFNWEIIQITPYGHFYDART